MDDQRDYAEEAANRQLMREEETSPVRSMFVTGCVCEGDECGGHRYTYDPPVVTREDQERGRTAREKAAAGLEVMARRRATMAAAQAGVFLPAEDPDPGMPLIRP